MLVLARYRACAAMSVAPDRRITRCTSTSASARPCLNARRKEWKSVGRVSSVSVSSSRSLWVRSRPTAWPKTVRKRAEARGQRYQPCAPLLRARLAVPGTADPSSDGVRAPTSPAGTAGARPVPQAAAQTRVGQPRRQGLACTAGGRSGLIGPRETCPMASAGPRVRAKAAHESCGLRGFSGGGWGMPSASQRSRTLERVADSGH